jgi:ubiquinone/menaquinone biosynthesis C-methylase UbiE
VTTAPEAGARVNRWVEADTAVDWAVDYLEGRRSFSFRLQGHDVLREVLAPRSVTRVLDLGTGDGDTLGRVLTLFPDATGIGVDVNPEMLRRAREQVATASWGARAEIVEHDLDAPLPDALGAFDLVVSSFAIHHCAPTRQRSLYGEAFAHLEPGGMFANLEHVASPTPELHATFLRALGKDPDDDDPSNQLVAVGTQLEWLRGIGFEQVDCLWKWREIALLVGVKP